MAVFIYAGYDSVLTFTYSLLVSSILHTALYHGYFYKRGDYDRLLPNSDSVSMFIYISIDDRISLCILCFLITFTHTLLQTFFNPELMRLYQGFFGQTLLKQLLTEGEKFVMTFWNPLSFEEQGKYDIVDNLSSLAARFVFAPIEESAYLLFTSLVERKSAKLQDGRKYHIAMDTLCNLVQLMNLN